MAEEKKQYSIKLDTTLYNFLEKESKSQQRSISNLIHVILYDHKNSKQSKKKVS